MDWYYARDKEPVGPLAEIEFQSLVSGGAVTWETLVWRPGMPRWRRYGEVAEAAAAATDAAGLYRPCAECGRMFPMEEMVSYGPHFVCAGCKPVFFQRIREGVPIRGAFMYAGFWSRAGAKFLDAIIILAVLMGVQTVVGMAMGFTAAMTHRVESDQAPYAITFIFMAILLFSYIAIPAAYNTWFIGKYQATPGKMGLGLKVITPDGSRISYPRALARFFAEVVSYSILLIGYIMAGFDDEKRTLHDRICDTRVVFK